jgi:hypothetical protein
MQTPVVKCKHCNRPITRNVLDTGEWIHKKTRSVPAMYYSCSMYSRIKSERKTGSPHAEPKELTDDTIQS